MATLRTAQDLEGLSPAARRLLQLAQELADSSSRDEAVAASATTRLTALAPTADELATLLGDRNPFVRSGAARWMRHLPALPAGALDALRAAVYDQNPYVVQAALGSAGILHLEAVRDDARACLEDSNPCVTHAAIFALGKLGPAEEGAHLVRFLESPEQHLQVAAVTALGQLRYKPAADVLLRRLEATCELVGRHRSQLNLATRFIHALIALEARNAVPLLTRIARDEVGLRGLAVQALIEMRAEEAAPALVSLLGQLLESTHEEKLSCRLLYFMTAVDYRFAMPTVRAFLGHRQPGVRCAALKAVATWRDADATDAVRQMAFDDVSAFVRPTAVGSLAELAGPAALPDLEKLAGDANALVRAAVAEALGKMTPLPEPAREVLGRLVRDEALAVARAAQDVLLLQPVSPPPPPAEVTPVPACLRDQASAARAFLKRWRNEVPAGEPDVAAALDVLLRVLS